MINKKSFVFVPDLDFTRRWTDEDLYRKFELNEEEIAYIEDHIKEMSVGEVDVE